MSDEEYLSRIPHNVRMQLEGRHTELRSGKVDWTAVIQDAEKYVRTAKPSAAEHTSTKGASMQQDFPTNDNIDTTAEGAVTDFLSRMEVIGFGVGPAWKAVPEGLRAAVKADWYAALRGYLYALCNRTLDT